MTRKETNTEILKLLGEINEKYNDLRFGQILLMAGINLPNDKLFEESEVYLQKIKENK